MSLTSCAVYSKFSSVVCHQNGYDAELRRIKLANQRLRLCAYSRQGLAGIAVCVLTALVASLIAESLPSSGDSIPDLMTTIRRILQIAGAILIIHLQEFYLMARNSLTEKCTADNQVVESRGGIVMTRTFVNYCLSRAPLSGDNIGSTGRSDYKVRAVILITCILFLVTSVSLVLRNYLRAFILYSLLLRVFEIVAAALLSSSYVTQGIPTSRLLNEVNEPHYHMSPGDAAAMIENRMHNDSAKSNHSRRLLCPSSPSDASSLIVAMNRVNSRLLDVDVELKRTAPFNQIQEPESNFSDTGESTTQSCHADALKCKRECDANQGDDGDFFIGRIQTTSNVKRHIGIRLHGDLQCPSRMNSPQISQILQSLEEGTSSLNPRRKKPRGGETSGAQDLSLVSTKVISLVDDKSSKEVSYNTIQPDLQTGKSFSQHLVFGRNSKSAYIGISNVSDLMNNSRYPPL